MILFIPFGQKLKEKKQTPQQLKQASDTIAIYYEIQEQEGIRHDVQSVNKKTLQFSIKKETPKAQHADWTTRSGFK
jgi:hypothetical protein